MIRRETEMTEKPKGDIDAFFEPQSIAAIGSMREAMFGGYVVIKNLLDFGFSGQIYGVNPGVDEVLGVKVYPDIREIPGVVDLTIIMVAAHRVPSIIASCVEKGVKAAVIAADGFAETGEEGAKLQREVIEIARRGKLRLIGPNTVGCTNPAVGLVPCTYALGYEQIRTGSIALAAQTGLIGPQAIPFEDLQYGISKICDFGNKCDVNEADLLAYLADDPQTKVIAMHLEDIRSGHRFIDKAAEVVPQKPVLIFKSGRTKESAKAVASHTGSLAGEYQVYDGALKQAGVIRVNTWSQLFDFAKVLSSQPLPKGNRVAIVTTTGGMGIVAVDTAVQSGLSIAELSPETLQKLGEFHHSMASNPIDVGPALPFWSDFSAFWRQIVEMVLNDSNVDCVAAVAYTSPAVALNRFDVEAVAELGRKLSKPITVWIYGTKFSLLEVLTRDIEDLDIPVYTEFKVALEALGAAFEYSKTKARGFMKG
jgi:acetyltransferase